MKLNFTPSEAAIIAIAVLAIGWFCERVGESVWDWALSKWGKKNGNKNGNGRSKYLQQSDLDAHCLKQTSYMREEFAEVTSKLESVSNNIDDTRNVVARLGDRLQEYHDDTVRVAARLEERVDLIWKKVW